MQVFNLLTSILIAITSANHVFANSAQFEDKKTPTKLQIKTGLIARSLEDKLLNSKYAGASLAFIGQQNFNEFFSAQLSFKALYTTGSYSNQYSTEGKAPNFLLLDEAFLTLNAWTGFAFDAGVVDVRFSSIPSTFDSVGFPSLRVSQSFDSGASQTTFFAMQAIPTSITQEVKPAEAGVQSEFSKFGFLFESNQQKQVGFGFLAAMSHFQFKNLTSSAAQDSVDSGNTIDAATSQQPKFRYQFVGDEAALGTSYQFKSGSEISLRGSYLKNNEAPKEKNQAYLYSIMLTKPIRNIDYSATVGYFYNESDTLPSTYSNTGRGNNNRFGQQLRLSAKNESQKWTGFVLYTRANEIEDKPYSADRETVTFTLEMSYDIL